MLSPDNIEILCAILFGMVFKLYDDLKDGGFVRPGLLISAIYLAIGFLVAIISYNDFIFAIALYSLELTNYLANPSCYAGIEEKSAIYAFPLLILISLPSAALPNLYDVGSLIFYVMMVAVEDKIVHEEFSKKKLMVRGTYLILVVLFLMICGSLITKGITKIFLYNVGYLGVSVCFQLYYQLRQQKDKLEKKMD
jgi:hypothetical protein